MGMTLPALGTRDHYTGSREPPTPNIVGSGTTTTPKAPLIDRRSCHCRPSRTAVSRLKWQAPPKRMGSHSERSALTTTRSPRFHPVFTLLVPRFYPVFPLFYSVFTPLLPHFTPFRFIVLPRFYLVFTPSRSVIFTPVSPHFYPTFTPPPVFTLSSVLPRFYPVPSTLRKPSPPFLLPG